MKSNSTTSASLPKATKKMRASFIKLVSPKQFKVEASKNHVVTGALRQAQGRLSPVPPKRSEAEPPRKPTRHQTLPPRNLLYVNRPPRAARSAPTLSPHSC